MQRTELCADESFPSSVSKEFPATEKINKGNQLTQNISANDVAVRCCNWFSGANGNELITKDNNANKEPSPEGSRGWQVP